jgi:hypothetical protein
MEVGEFDANSIAPFQHESFGDSLVRCQRYFEKSEGTDRINGFGTHSGQKCFFSVFKINKRATPTMVIFDGAGTANKLTTLNTAGTQTAGATVALTQTSTTKVTVFSNNGTNSGILYSYTASAEL